MWAVGGRGRGRGGILLLLLQLSTAAKRSCNQRAGVGLLLLLLIGVVLCRKARRRRARCERDLPSALHRLLERDARGEVALIVAAVAGGELLNGRCVGCRAAVVGASAGIGRIVSAIIVISAAANGVVSTPQS